MFYLLNTINNINSYLIKTYDTTEMLEKQIYY